MCFNGWTALHIAAWWGHADVARFLCKAGANINKQNRGGLTPLHCAAWRGYTQTVKCLVEHNTTVDVRDKEGWTPLHCAAWGNHTQIVKCFLEHKATVDVRTQGGETPLHCAAERGYTQIVRCLVQHNATVDVRDKNGRTAYDVCHDEEIKIVLERHMRQKSQAQLRTRRIVGTEYRPHVAEGANRGSSYRNLGPFSDARSSSLRPEYDVDRVQLNCRSRETETPKRSFVEVKPNATIDGASGGDFRWKEVTLKVPPHAISGQIKVDIVDQPLLVQAVHDKTKGSAYLHRQGIRVSHGTDEDVVLSTPVEVRASVRSMLEEGRDQRLDSQDFGILREKNGEVTDFSKESGVRRCGEEIVFYTKTFAYFHIVCGLAKCFLETIKNTIITSYSCRICPYIKGGHNGFIVNLYCHGVDVVCSADLKHECLAKEVHLRDKTELWFEVKCRCIKTNDTKTICSRQFELHRNCCEKTGNRFSEALPDVKPLVAK